FASKFRHWGRPLQQRLLRTARVHRHVHDPDTGSSRTMTGTDPARIEADYLLETAYPLEAAAEAIAGEQSSGTFVAVPGETPELKARASARVECLTIVGEPAEPSL